MSADLAGLVVVLPDRCRSCAIHEAVIGVGAGPHIASLHCQCCDQHRGWLSHDVYEFLFRLVEEFGVPPEPVECRGIVTNGEALQKTKNATG
jgi:hypothetical protein